MKVLINSLPHVTGGGITYLENMLPRLAGNDGEYIVLVPAGRQKVSEPDAANVELRPVRFPTDFLLTRLFYEQFVLPIFLWYWNVDILFSPADLTPLMAPCPAVLAIRNPNPYFSVPNIERTKYTQLKLRAQRFLTRISARKADRVFFVSEFSKQVSNAYLGIDESKVHVIHHGIEPALFEDPVEPSDNDLTETVTAAEPYLLTVSTINEHKNYETLLRGYAQLPSEQREDFKLLIAGRNSAPAYFETLQEIVDAEGIDDEVTFLGEVDYRYVPYLYDNASVYILPSKLETFGHTLVEAMASEVPIVAADATCIPEITDGAAALFDPDDPAALAATLKEVLTDEHQRQDLVTAGRDRVQEFSWGRTADRTTALLKAVHDGRTGIDHESA